jgi:hypothetical protein
VSALPQRWLHNLIDIIAHGKHLGKSYWKYHQWKDEPSQTLGKFHRQVRHDDYKKIIQELKEKGISINADNPYDLLLSISSLKLPEKLKSPKEVIVGWTHEILDQVWSSLSREDKLGWAEAFRDVYVNPSRYFENNLLEPDDLKLREFIETKKYVMDKKIQQLI